MMSSHEEQMADPRSLSIASNPRYEGVELVNRLEFTFYGDLLGIAAAYRLGASFAYEHLNEYYNLVFSTLIRYQSDEPEVKARMFSDSMLVWGKASAEGLLEALQQVYLALFARGLLLRGAIVEGALQQDHRLEGPDFQKFLPSNDTLARAVGLEKTQRGARCLVSIGLANQLLAGVPEWLTIDGYVRNAHPEVPRDSILRRLCPTPSGSSYELLYFWRPGPEGVDYRSEGVQLNQIRQFLKSDVAAHYRETEALLRRSKARDFPSRGKRVATRR